MTPEHTTQLYRILQQAIVNFDKESYDLTVYEVVGVLEAIKADYLERLSQYNNTPA
jgi:hypothetical protein